MLNKLLWMNRLVIECSDHWLVRPSTIRNWIDEQTTKKKEKNRHYLLRLFKWKSSAANWYRHDEYGITVKCISAAFSREYVPYFRQTTSSAAFSNDTLKLNHLFVRQSKPPKRADSTEIQRSTQNGLKRSRRTIFPGKRKIRNTAQTRNSLAHSVFCSYVVVFLFFFFFRPGTTVYP